MSEAATIQRADALMARGDVHGALALTERLVSGREPSHSALAVHSVALKLVGRADEALRFDHQAVQRFGSSPTAWHNYATTLADLGRPEEALAACERSFALGMQASQTFAIYARVLRATGKVDEGEAAYRESLKRTGDATDVAAEYADFIWMRRGDVREADAILDAAFHAGGAPTPLLLAKAKLYDAAGEAARGADLLKAASERMPGDVAILLAATDAALRLERLDEAQVLTRMAQAAEPGARAVIESSAFVDLALGHGDLALAKLKGLLASDPEDQSLLGWAATAARAVGDPLYGELCDYDAVVGVYDLATPEGWPDLGAFLADLGKSLGDLHLYEHAPTNQSLRLGSQTMSLLSGADAAPVRAFFKAVDGPIREHMAKLGGGADPLRRRNSFDYRIQGAWSVRLRPGGFHRDHFHPQGWLSSAFYVETPVAALETADRQGWIRFGQPPLFTQPALPPAYFVKPKPGRLVLFPSYLWHGTVPFATAESRLSVAFDVVPKQAPNPE